MRLEIIPNFATQLEITTLNEWANLGVANKWLDLGISKGALIENRLTSRLYGDRFYYPDIVRALSKRIRQYVGVDAYPLIDGHGRDGVVVSYTLPGGDVYKHKDPGSIKNPGSSGYAATLRCNILTQKADAGGALYVDGNRIDVEVGDLHCYLVSEHEHWVTEVEGNTPRIMWMFGAHVPAEDWNNGTIKVNNGLS